METLRNLFLWAADHPAAGTAIGGAIGYFGFQISTLILNYLMFRYPDDVMEKMKKDQPLKAAFVIMWKSISFDTQKTIESGAAISSLLSGKTEKKEEPDGKSL